MEKNLNLRYNFPAIVLWFVSTILGLSFFLPFKSCSNCLTPDELMKNNVSSELWHETRKGTVEKKTEKGETIVEDCYWNITYYHAYDETVNFFHDGKLRPTAFLFVCFFWPLVLLMVLKFGSVKTGRYLTLGIPVFSLLSGYWIFSESFLFADIGAYIALACTSVIFLIGIIDIIIRRSEIFIRRIEK